MMAIGPNLSCVLPVVHPSMISAKKSQMRMEEEEEEEGGRPSQEAKSH